jgi:hypothetical protein
MIQLLTSFYRDPSLLRQGEIMFCLEKNFIAKFDRYIFFCENAYDADFLLKYITVLETVLKTDKSELTKKTLIITLEKRPTYNNFLETADKYADENTITVFCNSDIFFEGENVAQLNGFFMEVEANRNLAICLTRWDYQANQHHVLFDRPDSQDTWAFRGKPKGRTSIEFTMGTAGCVSGDAIVNYKRGKRSGSRKIKIKDLYLKLYGIKDEWDENLETNIKSFNESKNTIFYNGVLKVSFSGEKECIKITTKESEIELTEDHMIYTPDGYKKACDLNVGDLVSVSGTNNVLPSNKKKKYRNRKVVYIKYHPFAEVKYVRGHRYKRLRRYRLVYEAKLNNMSFDEYVSTLRNDEEKSKSLVFLDPKTEVHHIDNNTENDDISNLEVMSKEEHAKIHSKEDGGFVRDGVRWSKILQISNVGIKEVFDITMKDQSNPNFLANNIVVHNCDNRFAYELTQMGYILSNPSKRIKSYHVHTSNVRNYLENDKPKEIVPEPYQLIHPHD